ncbi:MAG: tetratricopeptide repeat-containing serine protease family protein [Burkholderiales bacterium]
MRPLRVFACVARSLSLAALFLAASGVRADEQIDPAFVVRIAPSLVKVEASNADGSTNLGSAVVVAHDVAATNCHVIARARAISVVRGAVHWPVQALRANAGRDLCLLYTREAIGVPIVVEDRPPRIDQPVVAIGFAGGAGLRFSAGKVKAVYDFDGGKVIRSDSAFASGSSGGALLDLRGRLLGIVTFKSHAGRAYHFALPAQWLREELAAPRVELRASGAIGPAFWQQPLDAQPFFLRANRLEADRQWQALATLADAWIASTRSDANAWMTRGKAEFRMQQLDKAVSAFRESARLDGQNSETWYYLGLAHAARGDLSDAVECYRRLMALSEDTALALSREAGLCGGELTVRC